MILGVGEYAAEWAASHGLELDDDPVDPRLGPHTARMSFADKLRDDGPVRLPARAPARSSTRSTAAGVARRLRARRDRVPRLLHDDALHGDRPLRDHRAGRELAGDRGRHRARRRPAADQPERRAHRLRAPGRRVGRADAARRVEAGARRARATTRSRARAPRRRSTSAGARRRRSRSSSAPTTAPIRSGAARGPPATMPVVPPVAFFGPSGTFTEEALLSQPDLAAGERVALASIPDVARRGRARRPRARRRADRELDRGLGVGHARHARLRARAPHPARGRPADLAQPVREAGHDARRRHDRALVPARDRAVPRVAEQEAARRRRSSPRTRPPRPRSGSRARSGPTRPRSATSSRPASTA